MPYQEIKDFIIENVGGLDNLNDYNACSTSMLLDLADLGKVKESVLKDSPDIITTALNKHLKVVIGPEIVNVHQAFKDDTELNKAVEEKKNVGLFRKLINIISGTLAPVLMILAATGMIKGFLALFVFLGWLTESSGTYTILYAIGDGFFYYLPIFLGSTAAKQFGINRYLGMAIGAALVYPTIVSLSDLEPIITLFQGTIIESEVYTSFLGIPVILPSGGYVSTVIPVILSVAVASLIFKFWNKILPEVVQGFLSPCLTLVIIVPLTFIVFGPIAQILASLISTFAEFLYSISPALEGIFIAALWQPLVIFGLHWSLSRSCS